MTTGVGSVQDTAANWRRLGLHGLSVVTVLLSACIGPRFDDTLTATTPPGLPGLPAGPSLKILVIGDYGTGGPGQRAIAKAIAETHRNSPPDLVITVGDNIYPEGATSIDDPLWDETLTQVYTGPFWEGLVFHPSLGNHDHAGSVQAQIDFSRVSAQWSMPNRFYSTEWEIPGGGAVRLIAVDTQPLTKDEGDPDQERFLSQALTPAPGTWILPYGHHPAFEVGRHGEDRDLVKRLRDRFLASTQLYIAGHDHLTAMIRSGDWSQVTCGGGGGSDNAHRISPRGRVRALFTNGGWCFLYVFPDQLVVELYNGIGTLRHRGVVRRRGP